MTPHRFTSSTHFQSASVRSAIWPPPPTPALLQSTCTVPKRSHDVIGEGLHRRRIADIGLHTDDAELTGRRLERGRLDVGDDDLHAIRGEPGGHRPPDATRPAGDDRDLAFEVAHVSSGTARPCTAHLAARRGTRPARRRAW